LPSHEPPAQDFRKIAERLVLRVAGTLVAQRPAEVAR
jgi:hypothetical protein